ncbi:MAG: cell division protein FtsQ, partial [Gammaproteobacteria bacterium]|nr:cell division protein FtsQ [Gammaproteobacteria bacterium]
RAAVRRVWPDRLTLTVVEREPLARWGEADVISRRGETFRPSAASIPEGLPVLEGPPGRAQALAARYRELERALAPTGLGVRRLAQDARRSLRLELSNGIELRLGGKAVQARLARFVRSYAPALARRAEGIRYVDLRYTNGFAVGWAAGSAPQAPGRG